MCIMQLQNYIMICEGSSLMKTMNYQMPKEKIESKYYPDNLFLKTYNYDVWFKNEESTDKEESIDATRKSDKEEL